MDIWQELYEKARAQYGPQEVSPFVCAHHVVCALESENGGSLYGLLHRKLLGRDGLVRRARRCAQHVSAERADGGQAPHCLPRQTALWRRQRPCPAVRAGNSSSSCRKRIATWKSLWILRRAKRSGWSRWSPTGGAGSATSRQRKHSMYADGGRSFGSGLRPPLFCLKAQLPDKKSEKPGRIWYHKNRNQENGKGAAAWANRIF